MDLANVGRVLVAVGVVITLVGVGLWAAARFFPGLGQLPGDIRYQSGNVRVYFPIVTMILLSIVVTIVLNVAIRLFRR